MEQSSGNRGSMKSRGLGSQKQSMKSSGLKGIQQSNLGSGKKEGSKKTLDNLEELEDISGIQAVEDESAIVPELKV